jgi:acetyltransferase-like isoleucine patch superfamily enzyme
VKKVHHEPRVVGVGVYVDQNVVCGRDCCVAHGSYVGYPIDRRAGFELVGPTTIGDEVEIGCHCILEEGVRLGDRVSLDHYVRVGANTSVGPDSYLLYGTRVHRHVTIGSRCRISGNCPDGTVIGDDVTHFGDKDSLYELGVLLSRLFPSVPLVRYISDELPRDAYDHNLIVVGGPGVPGSQGNRLVATLQQRLGIAVGYSADAERLIMPDGEERSGEFESGHCTLDHGFFAKARNPFNPAARVFMLHGIYTMGVLGAARLLSDHPAAQDNVRVVVDEIGADTDLWCVLPVHVLNGMPMVPRLTASDVVRI